MSGMVLNPVLAQAAARRRALQEAEHAKSFKVGDHVHTRTDGGEWGILRHTITALHSDGSATVKTPDKPSLGGGASKRVHTRNLRPWDGKMKEAAEGGSTAASESATSKTPASVHVGKVFDDKNPADSYPAGTEINFGEEAPVDMGGIPDLFDPAAVTGDGI